VRLDAASSSGLTYEYNYGTGVFLSSRGLIATAAHNVRSRGTLPRDQREVVVMTRYSSLYAPADVVAVDDAADLAILRVNMRVFPHIQLLACHSTPSPKLNAEAYVLGIRGKASPGRFELGIIEGVFADPKAIAPAIPAARAQLPWIGLSQMVQNGYSGGAVLNEEGCLVGIFVGALEKDGKWLDLSLAMGLPAVYDLFDRQPQTGH
jgi:S1-C subfamily serine protease